MKIIQGIAAVILIILILDFLWQWITLPWKIDKSNDLLREILEKLEHREEYL
ncbi:hypothetical protein [Clostridium kluyveri]|uniref:hypothetical protein n=1 Tax=Clostridium kluyveri TaxID=1534 RepID=UPI0012EB3B06|nr:hypothetical protein [Clostridium kluyveri]UZQ49556.1 hypothetical protein OP486_16610 [Clostridium kluyveri]